MLVGKMHSINTQNASLIEIFQESAKPISKILTTKSESHQFMLHVTTSKKLDLDIVFLWN